MVKLEPAIITSPVAGIGACENGGQWRWALALLSGTWHAKLVLRAISYNTGISACETGEW